MKIAIKIRPINLELGIVALLFSIAAGFQIFGESRDVNAYDDFYEQLGGYYDGRFEFLFVYLSRAIKWITGNLGFYIFSLSFIGLVLKLFVLSKFKFFNFSLLLYLLILFPLHELTQYRVSLALGFLYLGFYFSSINKHIYLRNCLFVLAFSTHYSTLAFLPFVVFWKKLGMNHPSKYLYIGAFLAALFAAPQIIFEYASILNPSLLVEHDQMPNIFSSRNIVLFVVILFGFFKIKDIPKNIVPFFFISIYGFYLWGIFYNLPVFAHRLFEASFMSYIIWVTYMRRWVLVFSMSLMLVLACYLTYRNIYIEPLFY